MPTIRRRVIRRSNALRVTNLDRRDSIGVESLSSVAPPCYTSQREAGSSVAASDEVPPSIDPSEDNDSVSMHSCPDIAPQEILPSPYSTEDLFADIHRIDNHDTEPAAAPSTQAHGCMHGYTHTHSQCTIDMPPAASDSHLGGSHSREPTPGSPFPGSDTSTPYPYLNQRRSTRYSSTPTTPYTSQRGRASDVLSPSPRPILYHHRHSSQPAAIGHLTQRSLKAGYELHLDPSDLLVSDGDNTPPVHTPVANSTITFLQEDPYGSQNNYRNSAQRRAYSALSTSYIPPSASASTSYLPAKQRATNYVCLSRKSTSTKATFFGRKPAHSSITGNFTIDPSLYIPTSLLKAIEPRSLSLADVSRLLSKSDAISESARKPSSKSRPRSEAGGPKVRRKNLVLEVENGGIDVDVHLVPEANNLGRHSSSGRKSVDTHVQETHFRSHPGRRPSSRQTQVQGYDLPSDTNSQAVPSPTLIDLRLKSDLSGSRRSRQKSFSLVARIHAPTPRPPFHLLASTININTTESSDSLSSPDNNNKLQEARLSASLPPSNAVPASTSPTVQSQPDSKRNAPQSNPVRKKSGALRKPLSRSHLTLHLPQTFRGPLTVHVAAGNIDEHVRLSKAVASAAVVLSESAFSRGFYLGGSSPSEDDIEDENDPEEDTGGPFFPHIGANGGEGIERDARRRAGDADPAEEEAYPNAGHEDDDDTEWRGDKVDVVVGDGKVYLQFIDEEDPFGKKGRFWKNLFLGYK